MRMAARIKRIRLARSVSLGAVEVKAGFAKGLMARLEAGQEVPPLATLDTLAEVLDVPLHVFFYDAEETGLTPRSAPRLTLQELAEESQGSARGGVWSSPKGSVGAAIKAWSGSAVRVLTRARPKGT